MDFLQLIFDAKKFQNTCCLCLTSSEYNINIYDVVEILDKQFKINVSLQTLIKTTLPQHDILLNQACTSCTDLIIELFIILQKSYIKKCTLLSLLNRIDNSIDKLDYTKKKVTIDLRYQRKINRKFYPSAIRNICGMEFNTRYQLNNHTKLAHKQKFDAKICSVCGIEWPTTKQLKAHLNCHTYKECPHCFKMLKTHAHYNKHVKKHLRPDNELKNINNTADKTNFVTGNLSNDSIKTSSFTTYKLPNGHTTSASPTFMLSRAIKLYENTNEAKEKRLEVSYTTTSEANFPTLKYLAYESYCNSLTMKTICGKGDKNFGIIHPVTEKPIVIRDISKPLNIITEQYTGNDFTNTDIPKNNKIERNQFQLQNNDNLESHINYQEDCGNIQFLCKYEMNANIDSNAPVSIEKFKDCHVENTVVEKTHNYYNFKDKPKGKVKRFFLCDRCSYKSVTKLNLEAHYNKTHLNIRPYACHVCLKSFYRKSNLSEHVLTHNNMKNLTCEVCGSNFVSMKTLETHLKIHEGVKKFHCNICNKYFVVKRHLNEHIKRSHAEKLISCLFCEKRYGLRKDFNRHVAKVHHMMISE